MIIGCDETRITKIINKESNKRLLRECLEDEKIREAISQSDMQLLFDNLRDDYLVKDLLKIVPLLLMLLMSVKENINANKLLEHSSDYLWRLPLYYMELDKLEFIPGSVFKLTGCSINTLIINPEHIEEKLSEVLKTLNLKKCKINVLLIESTEDGKEYLDMSEEEIREYVKSVEGKINIIK